MRLENLPEALAGKYDTVLLDRDGTINVHIIGDYVRSWDEFEFVPGALEALAAFAGSFRHVFIVTNQRGVGRGKFTPEALADIHERMVAAITAAGGRIDGVYCCTAVSDGDPMRKPNRGMFDQLLSEHPDVDPERTVMIGDGDVDMEFARNCGIDGIRIESLKKDGDKYIWKR